MLVKDMMKNPVCVEADDTLDAATRKLMHDNVGCLLVCEGKRLLGMITDRDILLRCVARGLTPDSVKARDAMTSELHFCLTEDPIERAAEIMAAQHVRRLPVLDAQRQLVGIISRADIFDAPSGPAQYQVAFYKDILDSQGRRYHSELQRVTVSAGHSREQAIAAAIKQVEAAHGRAWNTIADGFDVEEVRTDDSGRLLTQVEQTTEKEDRIRRRAYQIWAHRGGGDGHMEDDWAQACREIGPGER